MTASLGAEQFNCNIDFISVFYPFYRGWGDSIIILLS